MSNAEDFLDAFVSIEKSMNRIVKPKEYIPFTQLLTYAAKKNPVIRNRFDMLKEYSELRNAIVHQRGSHMEIIAEPSDSVTKDIIRISRLLEKDQNILCYATQPVRVVNGSDTIKQAFETMKSHKLNKIPVYEEGKCVGLLSMDALAEYAMEKDSSTQSFEMDSVRILLNSLRSDRVVYVDRYATVQDVILIFDNAFEHHLQAPVIIITEHGLNTEKPMGILSSYDLTKIIAVLS